MSNVRVYELSKELNKSNTEILNAAKGLGISVKSHASSISEEEAKKIRDRIASYGGSGSGASQKAPVDDTEKVRVFRGEKRRRGRRTEAGREGGAPEEEEAGGARRRS